MIKVAVYTAISPIAQNETGLATVMGHKVAHAVARNGGERMCQGLLTQLDGVVGRPADNRQKQRHGHGLQEGNSGGGRDAQELLYRKEG